MSLITMDLYPAHGVNQRGFLTPTLILVIALGIALLAATILGKLLFSEKEAHAKTRGEYAAFVAGVEKLGKEQEARNEQELKRREKVNNATVQSYKARTDAARARADSLCQSAGLGAGCRDLSAVPSSARPANDSERDQRLLTVLQHAQQQAEQLKALQEWVRSQERP